MTEKNRIIVIGAGISGLACAKELQKRDHDVLVVEGRSRVGGRLKGEALQLEGESQYVDLGGALIHGIEDNPVHRVTTQMGVPLHEISDYCLLLDEHGWPFDPKQDERLSTLYNECLDETFRRIEKDKTSPGTFGDLFDKVCKEKGVKVGHPLLKWHQANLELPTGADFHQLGYTWNDDEPYGFEGAHAAPEPSWNFVMNQLAEGLDIIYDSPVTQIQVVLADGTIPKECAGSPSESKGNNKSNDEEENDIPVKVITRTEWRNAPKDKEAATLTPVRKSRRIRGEDVSLRRSSRSTKGIIQKLTVGHDQGIFSYDDPSKKPVTSNRTRKTPKQKEGINNSSVVQVTLSDGTILEAGAVVCTLPLGILKIPQNQPGHVSFVPPLPEYKRKAIGELGCGLLNKCAISFSHVFWQDSEFLGLAAKDHSYLVLNATKYTGKPILIFMYGGSFAKEVESWTDNEVVEDCLEVLRRIVGNEVPYPIDYCVTRWGQEQFSKMSFTYIPSNVDGHTQLTAAGEAIYDPTVPDKPLIMFAGEHTTPYHPSTMHGAFLSGIREAYRYDLYVSPELNGNMEFETDHMIYDFTFPIKQSYRGPKMMTVAKKQDENKASNRSTIRGRRQRFANMALRKSPAQVKRILDAPSEVQKLVTSPESSRSRRSARSISTKRLIDTRESPSEKENTDKILKQKEQTEALENRTLKRALESYGRDAGLISSKIFPVFQSSTKPTKAEISSHWRKLTNRGRKKLKRGEKSWRASIVIQSA